VIVLPLLQNGELAGVFEVFSTWPSAFGERDERTLEALSQRVLRNLERASEPISAGTEPSRGTPPVTGSFIAPSTAATNAASSTTSNTTSDWNQPALDRLLLQPASEAAPGRKMNLVTLALSAAVLAYAVLLTVLVAQRLSGRRATARVRPPTAVSGRLIGAASQSPGAAGTAASSGSTSGTPSGGSKSSKGSAVPGSATSGAGPAAGASRARDTSPPEGSLQVYENGKEVFHMNPPAQQGAAISAVGTNPTDVTSAHGTADGTEVQRAAAVEPAAILKLPAEEAEGSLLHRVEPDYPEAARQQQIQGMVVLDLHVGQDGSVQKVTPVSGPALLAQAATTAVKQWRFKPRLVSGRPAEMQTRITLNFRLPQ